MSANARMRTSPTVAAAQCRTICRVSSAATEGEATVRLLPCHPDSAPEARRLAADAVADLMAEEQRGRFLLALSEVVSNAIRHSGARDSVRLAMTPKEGYLCVQVTDGGAGLVPQPGAMDTEGGAGFGLFIVEQVTRRWGMTREEEHTRVWFEIDFAPGEAEAERSRQTAA